MAVLFAGAAGLVTIVASSLAGGVYDKSVAGDPRGIVDKLADQVPQSHSPLQYLSGMVGSLWLTLAAFGLLR